MTLITSTKVSNLGRTNKRHGRVQRPVVVIYQKLLLRVSSGVPNTEKQMKARGRRPSAFIVSSCLEPLMKHEARVFGIASETSCRLLLFVNNSYRM